MKSAELDRMGYLLDPVAFARELLEFSPDARQAEVLRGGAASLELLATVGEEFHRRRYCGASGLLLRGLAGRVRVANGAADGGAGAEDSAISIAGRGCATRRREQPDQLDAAEWIAHCGPARDGGDGAGL